MPFVKGDILYLPHRGNPDFGTGEIPFVFDSLTTVGNNEQARMFVDSSDMRIAGYFPCDDGSVCRDGAGNYMDMEYFDLPCVWPNRIIKTVGSFLKGEIDLCLLLAAHRKFCLQEAEKDFVTPMYLEESLVKAGILPEKEGADE